MTDFLSRGAFNARFCAGEPLSARTWSAMCRRGELPGRRFGREWRVDADAFARQPLSHERPPTVSRAAQAVRQALEARRA